MVRFLATALVATAQYLPLLVGVKVLSPTLVDISTLSLYHLKVLLAGVPPTEIDKTLLLSLRGTVACGAYTFRNDTRPTIPSMPANVNRLFASNNSIKLVKFDNEVG